LRLLHQDAQRCIQIGEQFEERAFLDSPTKEAYFEMIKVKLFEIRAHREKTTQQSIQNGQLNVPMGNNGNSGMQNNMGNTNMGMNMMQNPGMSGMGMNMGGNMNMNMNQGIDMSNTSMGMPNGQTAMNGLQQSQNFPAQLQRQMQSSSLPQHLQGPQQHTTMDPAALRNPQMQPQMPNMKPQAPNMSQGGQLIQPTEDEIKVRARSINAQLTEERRGAFRNHLFSQMSEQQRQDHQANNRDPVNQGLYDKARGSLIREKKGLAPPTGQQSGNNMAMQNQMQGSMGIAANSLQQTSQPDFSTITGLQANAIRSQESGGEVVPASNHQSFGVGGQMNMAQGVNPQMLANHGNQPAGQPNAQQMKLAQLQRQKQQQLMHDQNQLAQRNALAAQQAQNHLRGQPGGLSTPNALNGGQVNSPAMNMNMLNRPMAPPGQNTPATPQQNRTPQGMPQTPMNPAGQLAQHHQSMLNQNMNQIGAQMPGNVNMERMLAQFPAHQREQVSAMNPAQISALMRRFMASRAEMNNSQPMVNMAQNPNIGGPPTGNPRAMGNGLPPNMENAIPNFTSQPPPNQQQPRSSQEQEDQVQKQRQHQQGLIKARAMDMQLFPKHILQNLAMQVSPDTDTWGKLREYVTHNQNVLPPNTMERLRTIQGNWYQAHPEQLQAALHEFNRRWVQMQQANQRQQLLQQQQQQQSQPQTAQPPPSMAMPHGQAPPAQMVPPAAPMQQPQAPNQNMTGMNMAQGQMRPPSTQIPTDADLKRVRATNPNPAVANMNDAQLRNVLQNRRRQMDQNAEKLSAEGLANGIQSGNMQAGQQQPSRPQQGTKQQIPAPAQGQKRPQTSNDDVIEIQNPSAPTMSNAPPPPAMQQTSSQQGHSHQGPFRPATQQEINAMTPLAKQQYMARFNQIAALRKANMATVNQNATANQAATQQPPAQQQAHGTQNQFGSDAQRQEDGQKIAQMIKDVAKTTQRGPAVQISAADLEQALEILGRLHPMMARMPVTYNAALRMTSLGEARLRQMMMIRVKVHQNLSDDTLKLKDYLDLPLEQVKRMEVLSRTYFHQMAIWQKNRQQQHQIASGGAQGQQSQPQPQVQPPPVVKQEIVQQAPPLNRKISQTGHGRKQSANTKAPPAPTDDKKFDWGSASSPHGIPKYELGRNELTPDKLKFPAPRKRKTGTQSESQSSTPAGQTGTPNGAAASPPQAATKVPTPEQLRKMQAQVKAAEPAKPKFRCDDLQCEKSISGFDNEDALKQHKDAEHQPIEDPFKFLMDTTEAFVDVDKSKAAPAAKAPVEARGNLAAPDSKGKASKSASATPAPSARAPGKPGATPASKPTADVAPAATPTPAEEKTLWASMAWDLDLAAKINAQEDEAAAEAADDEAREAALLREINMELGIIPYEGGDNYPHADWNELQGVSNWSIPREPDSSPAKTPESVDSHSTHDSDVSRTAQLKMNLQWDAWGDGDTGVPGFLASGDLGLGGLYVESDSDSAMAESGTIAEGDDGVAKGEAKRRGSRSKEEVMDWTNDVMDWDATFGGEEDMDAN